MINYEVSCGEHIELTVIKVLDLAKEHNDNVKFSFNGVVVVVSPYEDCPDTIIEMFYTKVREQQDKYEKSQGYLEAKSRQEKLLAEKQLKMDRAITCLQEIYSSDDLLPWLLDFIPLADHFGVIFDKDCVLFELHSFGFKENECVGEGIDIGDYDNRKKWLIGQVISCLNTIGTPHPMLQDFTKNLINDKKEKL